MTRIGTASTTVPTSASTISNARFIPRPLLVSVRPPCVVFPRPQLPADANREPRAPSRYRPAHFRRAARLIRFNHQVALEPCLREPVIPVTELTAHRIQ